MVCDFDCDEVAHVGEAKFRNGRDAYLSGSGWEEGECYNRSMFMLRTRTAVHLFPDEVCENNSGYLASITLA
jgi:hypothetical protein